MKNASCENQLQSRKVYVPHSEVNGGELVSGRKKSWIFTGCLVQFRSYKYTAKARMALDFYSFVLPCMSLRPIYTDKAVPSPKHCHLVP